MRQLARLSLAVGGLSLALPAFAQAQEPIPVNAPQYSTAPLPASAPVQMPISSNVPAANRNAGGEFVIPTGVTASPKDARAVEAQLRRMGPPRVVSESYVVEGQPVVMSPSGSAPGRAVVSDAPGYQGMQPEARGMAMTGEPEPIGVMRTNYANVPPAFGQAPMQGPGGQMQAPGSTPYNPRMSRRGMPASMGAGAGPGPGSAPFLPSSSPNPKPRIFAHLFGFDGIGNAFRDARDARIEARKKAEILQMYQGNGNIDEVPASAVYSGRKGH